MKTIKLITACCIASILIFGCDLTSLNDNPNEPTADVDYNMNDPRVAETLRRGIPMEGDDEQRIKNLMIDFYAQVADGGGQTMKNYFMEEDWNQRMYRRIQSNVSSLNIAIRNLSQNGDTYANLIAVAKIWRVFTQASGIDFFGPIPFAPYREVEDNPPYMSVQDAYAEFFRELEEAVALIDRNSPETAFVDPNSDLIYKNDMQKWRRFANSLRLRYALRLSEADPSTCRTEAQKAIASGVMESTADNAYLPPKANGDWGQDYNYTLFQNGWNVAINMTSSFEKLVTNIGGIDFPVNLVNKRAGFTGTPTPLSNVHPAKADPRAPIMFDPAKDTGDWAGVPYGLPNSDYNAGRYRRDAYAELGYITRNGVSYKNRPYDVFLYEEICFLKAEAALRNFISGDAKAEYEKGVRTSFITWGAAGIDLYLASTDKNLAGTSANFDDQSGDGNTALEKIITQKYIAAFLDMAMESWNDKRRLNLPRFDVAVFRNELLYDNSNKDIKDPKNFIKRVQYPQQEATINKSEYDKGVQLLGGPDNVTTPIWWDKNANYCTSAE
ncbi:MAG: SusD/RagB family nutrient-binding outer membrane lipoprotein [Tannerella sp.]|jgi:hypothetical protein|nr:SusD/RagB family nutrient-binding outer membrane lipoprotein [Tannerella sp.]